jgi:hypothetical protein
MSVIQKSEELRRQAIELLITEREAIDNQLAILGHGQEKSPAGKKRGRPSNASKLQPEDLELPSGRSDTTPSL